MKKDAVIIFILAAAAIAAGPAAAQGIDSSTVVLPDSTVKSGGGSSGLLVDQPAPPEGVAEKADSTRPPWVAPVWSVEFRANESEYRLGTGMGLTFEPGGGWHGSSNLRITKRQYRGRDMSDINQKFNNSAIKIIPNLYNVNLAIGQDYLRQKAVGLARSGGDMVIENKFLNAGVAWERPELRASKSRFSLMGRLGGGQNDFKYDNNFQGNASGYLWYGLGPDLDVSGGYGIWRKLEDSDVSGRKFENMHSELDTISAKVGYGTGDVKLLSVDYKRTMGVVRKVDPPRGNSLEVIENPDLAKIEESSRKSEKIFIKSRIQPVSFLKLDFEFQRDYFDQQNVVDTRLSKEKE